MRVHVKQGTLVVGNGEKTNITKSALGPLSFEPPFEPPSFSATDRTIRVFSSTLTTDGDSVRDKQTEKNTSTSSGETRKPVRF